MFEKLNNSGIRGKALDLIKSYLRNRGFQVDLRGHLSQPNSLDDIGVPQGSILGPLLFLIYYYYHSYIARQKKVQKV